MKAQGYIEPWSDADLTLVAFQSAAIHMMDPKYREAFIAEAQLSEMIGTLRDATQELLAYLVKIEKEAEDRAHSDELARIIDRIGGFA